MITLRSFRALFAALALLQFGTFMHAESAKWGKVVRDSGAKVD